MKQLLLFLAFCLSNFAVGQSIVSVTPNNGNRGDQYLQVTITTQGVNFSTTSPTVDVSFIDQYSNVLPAVSSGWAGNNLLYATLTIPGYAIPGLYDVNVVDTGGAFNMTLPGSFTVNN